MVHSAWRATVLSLAIAGTAIACSSSPSNSGSSENCGVMAGTCSIQPTLSADSGAACPATPAGNTFAVNAGAATYTTAGGDLCTQTVSACRLQRMCSSVTGGTASMSSASVDVTFISGAYAGTETITVMVSGTTVTCNYGISGGNCSGSTDGG
jgi:hypothetical protein